MSEDSNPSDEPKIIVDDDWKSQVEQEKAALKEKAEEPIESEEAVAHELPPASFLVLLSTLATQSMAAMGIFPDPMTGKPNVNRPMAKHFIDSLAMLKEKTEGNLTEEEAAHLRDALHQLRMQYVALGNQPDPTPSTDEEPKSSSIELP